MKSLHVILLSVFSFFSGATLVVQAGQPSIPVFLMSWLILVFFLVSKLREPYND